MNAPAAVCLVGGQRCPPARQSAGSTLQGSLFRGTNRSHFPRLLARPCPTREIRHKICWISSRGMTIQTESRCECQTLRTKTSRNRVEFTGSLLRMHFLDAAPIPGQSGPDLPARIGRKSVDPADRSDANTDVVSSVSGSTAVLIWSIPCAACLARQSFTAFRKGDATWWTLCKRRNHFGRYWPV